MLHVKTESEQKINEPKGYNLHGDNQNRQLRNKKSKW